MPVDRLGIGLRRRHTDVIVRHVVKGAIAADLDLRARGTDQRLGLRQDHALGTGAAAAARRCLSAASSVLALLLRGEPIGIDDGGAALAFANAVAECQSLGKLPSFGPQNRAPPRRTKG